MARATLNWLWHSLLPWASRSLAHTIMFVVMVSLIVIANDTVPSVYWGVIPTVAHGWGIADIPMMVFHVLIGVSTLVFFGLWLYLLCTTYGYYFPGGRDLAATQPEQGCMQDFVDSLPEDLR